MGWIVNTLSCFDWIGPLTANLENAARGGGVDSWTFYFSFEDLASVNSGPLQVSALLTLVGCQPWGYMLQADTVTLSVPLEFATAAQYALDRAGVPIKSGRYE